LRTSKCVCTSPMPEPSTIAICTGLFVLIHRRATSAPLSSGAFWLNAAEQDHIFSTLYTLPLGTLYCAFKQPCAAVCGVAEGWVHQYRACTIRCTLHICPSQPMAYLSCLEYVFFGSCNFLEANRAARENVFAPPNH
jgi:hypothetical protein